MMERKLLLQKESYLASQNDTETERERELSSNT